MMGLLWIFLTVVSLAAATLCVERNYPFFGGLFVVLAAMLSSLVIWQ